MIMRILCSSHFSAHWFHLGFFFSKLPVPQTGFKSSLRHKTLPCFFMTALLMSRQTYCTPVKAYRYRYLLPIVCAANCSVTLRSGLRKNLFPLRSNSIPSCPTCLPVIYSQDCCPNRSENGWFCEGRVWPLGGLACQRTEGGHSGASRCSAVVRQINRKGKWSSMRLGQSYQRASGETLCPRGIMQPCERG